MSAILGRIHFDDSSVDSNAFHKVFESMRSYGRDGANTWVEGGVALGQHLLEVTPESRYERQPHHQQGSVIVADARIDNRDDLCDFFEISRSQRPTVPDSNLILRAYQRWGENCTAHLLGDFAFAIWDRQNQQLFCARDFIGTRPLYYHYTSAKFVFSTDLRALKLFPDINAKLDEFEIASYLSWPACPVENTFLKNIKILKFSQQLILTQRGLQCKSYWHPADSPKVLYRNTIDYVDHFRELFEVSVKDRVRTGHPVGSHISGGLDSSGVAILANRELGKIGRSLSMTYTWSPPKSEDYPEVQGDERNRIEAICHQENIPCHYGTSTAQDLRDFLTRDIATEFVSNLFEELPVMAHASKRNIRVMLSGWGGDEAASFNGRCYMAYLLKRLKILSLLKIARQEARGFRNWRGVTNLLCNNAVVPLLPNWLYNRVDPMYRPDRHSNYINPDLYENFFNAKRRKISRKDRLIGDPFKFQHMLLTQGHLADRMASWSLWSSSYGIIYCYPLLDRRIVEFMLGLPYELLYQSGQYRYIYRSALDGLLPKSANKVDRANEQKRANQVKGCLKILQKEVSAGEWDDKKMNLVNEKLIKESILKFPDQINQDEIAEFIALMHAIRVWHLQDHYSV